MRRLVHPLFLISVTVPWTGASGWVCGYLPRTWLEWSVAARWCAQRGPLGGLRLGHHPG